MQVVFFVLLLMTGCKVSYDIDDKEASMEIDKSVVEEIGDFFDED